MRFIRVNCKPKGKSRWAKRQAKANKKFLADTSKQVTELVAWLVANGVPHREAIAMTLPELRARCEQIVSRQIAADRGSA